MEGKIREYIALVRPTHDDDSVDRLNNSYTVILLIGFALTLFVKNYVGEPLQCWVPKQWMDNWETFSESYCFVENTYFVQMNNSLPAATDRESYEMVYYQWVPFVLTVMAVLFYAPRIIWKLFSLDSGIVLHSVMQSARNAAKANKASEAQHSLQPLLAYTNTREHRTSVTYAYIAMKILSCVNVIGQLLAINLILNTDYTLWGFGILKDMLKGRQWQESGHFPRVAYCDLSVREMGNINNWTVQCVLMVNMFNEKIFIFLWFWFVFVAVADILSLIKWLRDLFSESRSIRFLEDLLNDPSLDVLTFYRNHTGRDGVLYLRLIDDNCGRIVSEGLAKELYPKPPTPTS